MWIDKMRDGLSVFFFIIGVVLIDAEGVNIVGAVIGTGIISQALNIFVGTICLSVSMLIFMAGESLEEKVEKHNWKKYPVNKDSIIQDIEQEYLAVHDNHNGWLQRTPVQEQMERKVTGNGPIEETGAVNRKSSYGEQFHEGHAAKGGRVIDVESHIQREGKNQGKLMHFGQPANARYLWVVDEKGNFIVANRQTYKHEMENMDKRKIDYHHRLHKLPHATLAKGGRVLGSGEVLIEGGLVKAFNTASGHYIDLRDIQGFNEQGQEVFRYFMKMAGWKEVKEGAKYMLKS